MKGLDKMYGVKLPKDKEAPEASESEDAASDILAAIASKDAKALSLALERHYACCGESETEDDDEEV